MALWQYAWSTWLDQRGYLFPWVPVFLGFGVAIYFALKFEPSAWVYVGLVAFCGVTGLAAWVLRAGIGPLLLALALLAAGVCLAGLRAHSFDEPVLGWRYYGPVEGRIVGIDRSGSDAVRLTLDQVRLENVAPSKTPERVRISLHGQQGFITPRPGLRVMMTAHLSHPGGPVEPGGFDFQRHAWFLRLGAVGYTRSPVLTAAPPGSGQWMFKARMALSARVQATLPGETGGFAAAIMTGDRSGIGQDTLRALRVSNLAHLLAISGLHMGLLAGFVFAAIRLAFAAVPAVGLRVPAKKLSALMALPVAAVYLGLSGGNVATERAFVMVAVALVAVITDRRVLSLRAVAVAAVIVLVLRPEALLGPGFQMSFAATTALVAVFGWIRDANVSLGPRWARGAAAVVISSTVAGLATAPVAAAHFNQFAHYGLLANLASVPLMGVLVMPAAVLAACLLPFGLEAAALWVMGQGLGWILGVAHWVSGLDGARGTVVSPDAHVLPLMAFGALILSVWQGPARLLGAGPMVLAVGLWIGAERPDVLISDTGALVGVMTSDGRALNRSRGGGFVALSWLENDGDAAAQERAATRWQNLPTEGIRILALRGKAEAQSLTDCRGYDWIVLNTPAVHPLPCTVFDPPRLRYTGAIALYTTPQGISQKTARQITGVRLWNSQ